MSVWPSRALVWLIVLYRRFVSPSLGRHCRYHPSCSAYAQGCLERHGLLRGSILSVWRLLRCNPFCRGGHDPVPPRRTGVDRVPALKGSRA